MRKDKVHQKDRLFIYLFFLEEIPYRATLIQV